MKINKIKGRQAVKKSSSTSNKAGTISDFFNLIDGQLNPVGETAPPAIVQPVELKSQAPAKLRLNGIALSENTIDLLESYGNALGNLEIQPQDLAPLIEALEGDTTALIDIKEQLDSDDPLAQLIDQVVTISFIESEKYRRGDYLPS